MKKLRIVCCQKWAIFTDRHGSVEDLLGRNTDSILDMEVEVPKAAAELMPLNVPFEIVRMCRG